VAAILTGHLAEADSGQKIVSAAAARAIAPLSGDVRKWLIPRRRLEGA
jgi:hypothetical protein